jgi:hypothetical protein
LGNERYVSTEQISALSTAKSLTVSDNARAAVLIPRRRQLRLIEDAASATVKVLYFG